MSKLRMKVAMVLVAMVVVIGCAKSQTDYRQQYVVANEAFIALLQTLNDGRAMKVFSEERWQEKILPLINSGNRALRVYNEVTAKGESGVGAKGELTRVTSELKPFVSEVETRKEQMRDGTDRPGSPGVTPSSDRRGGQRGPEFVDGRRSERAVDRGTERVERGARSTVELAA